MPVPPTQILPGLWRIEATHPEWDGEGGGWDPDVAWWTIQTERGLLLVDPLVDEWDWLDERVTSDGGCAGVVRTIHWHQRSVVQAAERYGAEVWARVAPSEVMPEALDRELADRGLAPGGVVGRWLGEGDELVLWLPDQRSLLFGDAMIRERDGTLRRAPDDWVDGGSRRSEAVRLQLRGLIEHGPRHVLVSHGPPVVGDGPDAFVDAVATT